MKEIQLPNTESVFASRFAQCPIVAILRGVLPHEVVEIAQMLVTLGIGIIEVPLNSPSPFDSIELLSAALGPDVIIGAGTVLSVEDVARTHNAGGRLIVSPNVDTSVIAATRAAGLVSVPGYFTPSEAFSAVGAGAHAIKHFPAEASSPAVLKAQRAVLPATLPILVVGGVTVESIPKWLDAGANGFGLGGGIFRPGQSTALIARQASSFVSALQQRAQP
jgi:2-dehydro-3-deoxyphosphogalactonate aldolase